MLDFVTDQPRLVILERSAHDAIYFPIRIEGLNHQYVTDYLTYGTLLQTPPLDPIASLTGVQTQEETQQDHFVFR